MPNTKAVGVAFSDAMIEGGQLDSTTLANSNLYSGERIDVRSPTITTTGNTDTYMICAATGTLTNASFSGVESLTASDSNYITFSITNLGQAGAGSTALLAATDANTTKATGGTGLTANSGRTLTLNGTSANLNVVEGDRLRIRAAATGTLASTVTGGVFYLKFRVTSN